MCGIAGLMSPRAIDPMDVVRMTDAIAHRGPDDSGLWHSDDGRVVLGQRRLSIIDLSPAGHQPMASADGRHMLVLNGEVYNHRAIRAELATAGMAPPAWRGTSDTETFVAAVAAWGLDGALARAVGMFAVASWDRHANTLSLARDRFGEKPLYYGWVGDRFAFASELKAITRLPGFTSTIDRVAAGAMLARGYIPAPLTIHAGLAKLRPAHVLTLPVGIRPGDAMPPSRSYWSYRDVVARGLADPVRDADEAREGLRQVLETAIAGQAIADVPVGAFLSGGIDSSTIVALLQKVTERPVETFSIGFEEPGYDEAGYARAVAAAIGTRHHEHYVTAADAMSVIPTLPVAYDEPFADSSQIPTLLVSAFARRHVTVALTGDGGDELFGGYNRYVQLARAWGMMRRLPRVARYAGGGALAALPPSLWNVVARAAAGGKRRPPQFGSKVQRSLHRMRVARDRADLARTFLDEWALAGTPVAGVDAAAIGAAFGPPADPAWPDPVALMLQDAESYLPDDILCKVDRAAMAHSLEGRVPFLDHRVAEYAARIPIGMKIRGGTGKAILRDVLYEELPRALFDRPKAGFGIPVGEWLRGPLRDWAEALLSREALSAGGLLDPAPIRARWQRHLTGQEDATQALWSVLMLQAWRAAQP
ncbi:asparagine synthase (glutamine-hydrolyzing) [uncultured Sphingomonas sp.]|uniref:asparagine synthase (glutamine-hydrolyzing) n=1 Tax=uncultured Sphingomonas sp. TaxID=158754 RepID=UPI0025906DA5|nr:asparagine synthase (glutamine-hydrolyzing) [uncultured Sphingomonas sp.]